MIRADDEQRSHAPWPRAKLERLAVCVLWSTGPDTTVDGVFRMQAARRVPRAHELGGGAWETFDEFCDPFADEAARGTRDVPAQATARMVREYGVTGADLRGRPHAGELWPELARFLGPGPVLVLDAETFEGWAGHLARTRDGLPLAVGLCEAAALFFPGRLANRRETLVADLVAIVPIVDGAGQAFGPRELTAAWRELVVRFLERDADALALFTAGMLRVWRGLGATDARAAERLATLLDLFDRPARWLPAEEQQLFRALPEDGRLSAAAADDRPVGELFDRLRPLAARLADGWATAPNLPPDLEPPEKPFADEDRARLDEAFEVHLPAIFAREHGGAPAPRASQHAVARAVADAFGARELLLVHAPTGTGKTLAYLVPALLWARRHGVRVGVATYTRALQEQAMDRDVPRALSALARAGIPAGLRVSVLKGRQNYLCWRALGNAEPAEGDDGEAWLAWTLFALFGIGDPDGDLNRLPLRAPLLGDAPRAQAQALEALARQVRADTGCCSHGADRDTCTAELARRRAEKSHVVLTNHAFALSRQEFFEHVVFDECEHLHEQAASAWSHALPLRRVRALFERLHVDAPGPPRAQLDRLRRAVLDGATLALDLDEAQLACRAAVAAIDRLERAVECFEAWRDEVARGRHERDTHSLLKEYCADPVALDLLEARGSAVVEGNRLDRALSAVVERLDAGPLPLRDAPRARRTLEIARADLLEVLAALESWIPLQDGRPSFSRGTFHDVERNARGEALLVARVLLPNECLGRNYLPGLATGVFVSATTYLERSFEPARRYLGLERAEHPADDEQRPARTVRTFRAPEVFDYRRVLVAVPRDAPSPRLGKEPQLDYVRRFLAHLGERTRGRILGLFTNAADVRRVGQELEGFFRARRIPFWYQGMPGSTKEELGELFRSRVDSVLLGVDTFWYGADFPGETLEYLVIVRLPYGVPDRYHHAQCAALGADEQRRSIYRPRALAKFRQGFGRLMRRETDRGCVFLLDQRILEPQHRFFLSELPLERGAALDGAADADASGGARFVRGDTDRCLHGALAHMDMLSDVARRGLDWGFRSGAGASAGTAAGAGEGPLAVPPEDVPY